VFFAFTCRPSHLNYGLAMVILLPKHLPMLLCVSVAVLCLTACPSPSKSQVPNPDVAKVDQSSPEDSGQKQDPGEVVSDNVPTDLPDSEGTETQASDISPVDPGSSDVALDILLDSNSETQSTDVSNDVPANSDTVDATSLNDPGNPPDPGSPTIDMGSPDAVFCDPPQCQGAPAPQWTLTDFQESPPVAKSFDSFAGKVTVVMLLAAH